MSDLKEQVRPAYYELEGYLSKITEGDIHSVIRDENVWKLYHSTIDELNQVTTKNYDKFKVKPKRFGNSSSECIIISSYKNNLGGLISRLHAEYFKDEPHPFNIPTKTTNISLNANQNTSLYLQMILDVQTKIDQNIEQYKEGTKERLFLDKIKKSLSTVNSFSQFVKLVLNIAKEVSLNVSEVIAIFKNF